jgi:peptide deformylase
MPPTDKQGKSMSIRTYGDPVLRRPAEPVGAIDSGTRKTCERMVEAMIRADGVGLAAPQIGVAKRIIVLDVDGEFHVLINPRLVEASEETQTFTEGCLSVPGVHADVSRSERATVEGTGLDGSRVEITGEGLLARAIQHEMDHLDGHLFIDHLSPVRRRSLLKEYERRQREESD